MKLKVCKHCKLIVEGDTCPICKKSDFTTVFQGQINVIDPERSFIAKQVGIKIKGNYALKINH